MESPGVGVLVWVDRFQVPLACLVSAVACFVMGAVVGGKFWALAFSAMVLAALVSGVVIAIRVATATPAPVVELSVVPVSDDVRSRNLQAAIAHDVAATAGRVETVTPFSAVVVAGRPVNHILHLLVSVFMCGLWLPVWAFIAASGGDEYHGYPGADGQHEQKAWREFADRTGIGWTVVGSGPEQWAIRIL